LIKAEKWHQIATLEKCISPSYVHVRDTYKYTYFYFMDLIECFEVALNQPHNSFYIVRGAEDAEEGKQDFTFGSLAQLRVIGCLRVPRLSGPPRQNGHFSQTRLDDLQVGDEGVDSGPNLAASLAFTSEDRGNARRWDSSNSRR
jgi:hypothetical protein